MKVFIVFIMTSLLFITSYPAWGAVPEEWDGPWPGDYVWSDCCRIPQGSPEDVRIVRGGGYRGSNGGSGSRNLSTTISISARVHEWRHTWVRDEQVHLRINSPGSYQDWLTVVCVSSNALFHLSEVLPKVSNNALDQDSPLQTQISYAWRNEGGNWQLGLPAPHLQFSGLVQVVLLLEVNVASFPNGLASQEITFVIGS